MVFKILIIVDILFITSALTMIILAAYLESKEIKITVPTFQISRIEAAGDNSIVYLRNGKIETQVENIRLNKGGKAEIVKDKYSCMLKFSLGISGILSGFLGLILMTILIS